MERTVTSETQLIELLDSILPMVLEKGPSHTTMDYVASALGMSKRTLYEIFGSKDEMLRQVLQHQHELSQKRAEKIFSESDNIMESMVRLMDMHLEVLQKISPDFFRDMDERCKHLRPHYDSRNEAMNRQVSRIIAMGVKQGMFRKNCDFEMNLRLLRVQMESIKRMEDYFPPQITMAEAFYTIGQGFLRSIATQKGIEYLDRLENERK